MRRVTAEKYILISTIACAFIHVARVYLRGFIEDPDVGSFILLSQSFWAGDIFYTDFFDPKLPHILPVYTLSLLSGSIAGHLFFSLICVVLTGLFINLSGKNIWGGVFYVCLALISPGGSTGHLAVYANLFIALAYYSLTRHRTREVNLNPKAFRFSWLLMSSFLTGWAIGLRPNYGFALVPIFFWFILKRKFTAKEVSIWLSCCVFSLVAPILWALNRSGMNAHDFFVLFSSWNKHFYNNTGLNEFSSKILEIYSHPIGPANLGILTSLIIICAFISAADRNISKIIAFSFALLFLWSSYFISHTYSHYVLMDLLVVSLVVSSVRINQTSFMMLLIIIPLWLILALSPSNAHSREDALIIDNQRKIMAWLAQTNLNQVVSPIWLTPQWTSRNMLPTKGIHPEWSIGLLDRYDFKNLAISKKLGLKVTWRDQCKLWKESASIFIGTDEIYGKCNFKESFEGLEEFSMYPLKVWIKRR